MTCIFRVFFLYRLCGCFVGNPLSQDILNLYQEPDGTRKLLNYMLDNLAGKCCGCSNSPHHTTFYWRSCIFYGQQHACFCALSQTIENFSLISHCCALFPVHPEQLPQRPWITLKERDQMFPTGRFIRLFHGRA